MTYPSRPGVPPLSSTQILINTEMEEFQLVDLSRRFLNLDSFWSLPRQFLGNKVRAGCGGERGGERGVGALELRWLWLFPGRLLRRVPEVQGAVHAGPRPL